MLKLKKIESTLLFLTLLFLPTQLGKHFWPSFSYIYSLKIDYLSPTIYFWDVLVIGLLAVWFLGKPRINKLALNLLLLFLFTQAVSLFGAQNIGAGLVRLEQYLLAGLFGVYVASVIPRSDTMSDRRNLDLRKIATSPAMGGVLAMTGFIALPLSLGILGESLVAILQFIKGSTLGLWILGERSFSITTPGIAKFDFYGFQFLRPYGTFPHPNVLGGYLLITVVILSATKDLSRMRVHLRQAQRFFTSFRMTIFNISVLLGGLTIFLTMSRVVILAGILPLALIIKRKWLIFAILLFLIASPILFTRFSSLLNFDNLTLLRRKELLISAWQAFSAHPVFGVGLNNFIPAMSGNLISGPSRFLQPVHNILFLELAETGIIGLVGFLLLIGIPIVSSRRRAGSNSESFFMDSRPASLSGMTIAWLIIFFLGMFDHYFLTLPQGYRLLFLVWGLSMSVKILK